jgi:hypothetical protein
MIVRHIFEISEDDHPPNTPTPLVTHARDYWWTLDFANAFVSPGVNSCGELVPSHGASGRRLGEYWWGHGDKCSISSLKTVNFEHTNKWQQIGYKFCWFIPLIVGYFPHITMVYVFLSHLPRWNKIPLPANYISLQTPNPTWILDASRHPAKPVQAPQ